MAPKKKSSGSTKKKGKGGAKAASAAAASCVQCAKPVAKNAASRLECVCTRVVYCSAECRDKALAHGEGNSSHKCPGPPEAKVNVNAKMRELQGQSFHNDDDKKRWMEEYRREVSLPCMEYQRQKRGIQGLAQMPNAEVYREAADEGHAPSAYQVR